MLYCENCKIKVTGVQLKCPLCHCSLTGETGDRASHYPLLRESSNKIYFAFKLMKFVAIVSCVICALINYITYEHTMWSVFVVAGIGCGWLVMGIGIPRKANLIKVLQWELYITCGIAILFDFLTGWHKWSIEFVLPCACTACIVVIFILSAALKKKPKEYMTYLVLVDILGFLPLMSLFSSWMEIKLPSVISIICSTVFLVGIFLFKRNAAYGEMKKKLHV